MNPNNSLTVACRDVVVVAAVRNVAIADDVAVFVGVTAMDDVVVAVGDATAVVVWVQWC